MNEYNHHRIIERVAFNCGIDPFIQKQFMDASDYADFFIGFFDTNKPIQEWKDTAKQKYFFYRYYYNIKVENDNTICLNRVTSNGFIGNNSVDSMKNAGEKGLNGKYSLVGWNRLSDEKEFFSSVNDRKRSPHFEKGDTANQSDNVSFLHAMGAEGETSGDNGNTGHNGESKEKTSRSIFEDHLRKCFAEYLFLENEMEALFMLGIAFHGIMDSFTPSHMGFQKYTEQDMGLHAQGDVIPILNNKLQEEKVDFDPGQFSKEVFRNKKIFKETKYYDDDNYVNPVEYKMLRIFFYISDIQVDYGNHWGGVGDVERFWETFNGCPLKQIKDILSCGNYKYGPKSYAYSEAAIKVVSDIYEFLSDKRKECKNYTDYKTNKKTIVDEALKYWTRVYDGEEEVIVMLNDSPIVKYYKYSMKAIRKEHLSIKKATEVEADTKKEGLKGEVYFEDSEMKQYKDMLAQQKIDRLNSLID